MKLTLLLALPIGFVIDLILGDPHGWPHPVIWIGKLISFLEKRLRRVFPKTPAGEKAAGGVLWLLTAGISLVLPLVILLLAGRVSPWLRLALESIMCWQILATKSLRDESMKVFKALKTGDLEASRYAVSMIVGRDVARLDDKGVARAAVETVAENTSDGIVAPLIFMALGGAPLGFFYKAVNTMDSMLGYVEEPYKNIGFFPAKLDDVVNFLPARISALLMLLGGWAAGCWDTTWRPAGASSTGTATSMPAPIPPRPNPSAPGSWDCAWRGTPGITASCIKKSISETRSGRSNMRISPGPAACCMPRRCWPWCWAWPSDSSF